MVCKLSVFADEKVKHLRAAYLFMSYVFMDETLMPIRTMLSGHPNFLADIKAVPGMAAALFPHHPEATIMADHLEKSVALNLRYHTRPDVPAWNATGGRWTENLGTYTWAFLKPTLRATYLLHHYYDGRNRILQPNISLYAGWLLNGLTAPLDVADGKRVNPPQGAHAYGLTPSNLMRVLGQELFYYDPLLAEQLLYVTSPDDRGFEYKIGRTDPWGDILQSAWKDNKGTNPHLHSTKYTGYGYTLRTNFGKPNETYVHLQQIDDGPNYRWGRAAEGGNGVIYYYANGKRYSHNGIEDVGDAPFGDVERATNFGVKKPGGYRSLGPYRSVGRNDLTEPLFDFGHAQFARINGNAAIHQDYLSRSVLQSGSDYIIIFDHVKDKNTEGRFSWFVGKDDDYPNIIQILPGAKGADSGMEASKSNYHNDNGNLLTKGRYYDGNGSFLTLVSHKSDISAEKTDFGSIVEIGSSRTDYVFRSAAEKTYAKDGIVFRGSAGIVQHDLVNKTFQAALFQGKEIGIPGLKVEMSVSDKNGVSLNSLSGGFSGKIQINKTAKLTLALTQKTENPFAFYLNGNKIEPKNGNVIFLNLTSGQYNWQWGSRGLIPASSQITSTVCGKNSVEVSWIKVTGASSYQLEWSVDGGTSWQFYGLPIQGNKLIVNDLKPNSKIHIRVLAKGSGGWSEPSADYPVYITNQPPHAPEGIWVVKNEKDILVTWGGILGVNRYKLYRKIKGQDDPKELLIYNGSNRFLKISLKTPKPFTNTASLRKMAMVSAKKVWPATPTRHD